MVHVLSAYQSRASLEEFHLKDPPQTPVTDCSMLGLFGVGSSRPRMFDGLPWIQEILTRSKPTKAS